MPLLYERVVDHVAALIAGGTLRPGDRLPSVRRLSRQQRVSISTVVQAYTALEDRGLVEARPQSGHYVRVQRTTALPEPRVARPAAAPARIGISDLVAQVYSVMSDPSVVPLGAIMPDPSLLPTDKLNRMLANIARSSGAAGVGYDAPPGYLPLRRAISRRSAHLGSPLAPQDLVLTVGCMEALHLCLAAVTRPGDVVAIEAPAYFGVLQLLESMSLKACEIPVHPRTGLDLLRLEEVLSESKLAACIASPNFNNPLGCLMPDESKEKLVGLLARHEVPLIEDDVNGDIHFCDERPRPAKAFDRKGLVLLCGSFSKTLAPGYRVGWTAAGRFRDQVERLKFALTVANATLPQMAVAEFLENGGYDHHLRQLKRRVALQVERYTEAIADQFPPGTRVSRPAGGLALWVELPAGASALDLHQQAFARGISIAPGPIFSAKQRFGGYIRISCGRAWSEVIERAIRTLGRLAAEAADRTA